MKSSLCALLCTTVLTAAAITGCGTSRLHTASVDHPTPRQDRYVVILSLDGFRADYQGRCTTPNLDAMDKEGLAGCFRPSYPTLTFPNHYSMATGLYPNNHGLVGNEFWDERGAHYRLGDRKAVEDSSFYKGEHHQRRLALGCSYRFPGIHDSPSRCYVLPRRSSYGC